MKLIEAFLAKHRCYAYPMKIKPTNLMLHSVGVAQPSAPVIYRQWDNVKTSVCVHAFIEPSGTVHQTLPWDYKANHSGNTSTNFSTIGVEMTEPRSIKYTGGASFTDLDPATTLVHVKGCYNTAVELFADLCIQFDLDPLISIISHAEGAKLGLASHHADPEHLWSRFGITMDMFRKDVLEMLEIKIREIFRDEYNKLNPLYKEIEDVPVSLRPETKILLKAEAINGGTSLAVNPNDVNLRSDALRAVIIAKRYTDQ